MHIPDPHVNKLTRRGARACAHTHTNTSRQRYADPQVRSDAARSDNDTLVTARGVGLPGRAGPGLLPRQFAQHDGGGNRSAARPHTHAQ